MVHKSVKNTGTIALFGIHLKSSITGVRPFKQTVL